MSAEIVSGDFFRRHDGRTPSSRSIRCGKRSRGSAEHTQVHPDDPRPGAAVEAAWAFVNGAPRSRLQRTTSLDAHRAARDDDGAAPALRAGTTPSCPGSHTGLILWRCRESNPGPPSLHKGFSVRRPLCLYSDPPVMRTSRCDDPSRCLLSPPAPRPGERVSPLADAGVRVGERTRSDRLHTRSGGEGEISALVSGTCFFATGG